MGRKRTLVVLGMMGRCPFGGQTWLYLNWLRGFARLGHEVWYVEDDATWPYDPRLNTFTDDPGYAAAYLDRVTRDAGLAGRWAYRPLFRDGACYGLSVAQLRELYRRCDAILNVCGATVLNEDHALAPRRIYVETDPVTNQLELANGRQKTRQVLAAHDTIVSYGENYGGPGCTVPLDGGFRYLKTRQPVDLELWPMCFDPDARRYTTIGNWKQDGHDVSWNGETYYWSKHHEFLKFIELPRRRPGLRFEVYLNVDDASDRRALEDNGWHLDSPLERSLDPWAYQELFRTARAEWTVAKDQNVRLQSGWFSERDACFLASGKPVIAQSTGFENALPTGEGLFAFRTMDEALTAIDAVESDYAKACRAARAVAEQHLEATRVAGKFLEDVGL
jgi:hypothetical protein